MNYGRFFFSKSIQDKRAYFECLTLEAMAVFILIDDIEVVICEASRYLYSVGGKIGEACL